MTPLHDINPNSWSQLKTGDRIGVLASIQCGVVRFLGFGQVTGFELPECVPTPMARTLTRMGTKVPRILLDSGEALYAIECWWTDEKGFDKWLRNNVVEPYTVQQLREDERKAFEFAD